MTQNVSEAQLLASLSETERNRFLSTLTPKAEAELAYTWRFWARPNQIAPPGDWATWLILAGRGFGKTEAGAQWIKERVASGARSIALIAETQKDLEEVMVARLLSIYPEAERPTVRYKPVRITWPNGAVALGYNGTEPDQLRGPEFDTAWCFPAGTPITMSDWSEKSIEDVRSGDRVMTREGPRRVNSSFLTRKNARVYRLSFSDGRAIVCTGNHPIWVDGVGFVRADTMLLGDAVWTTNQQKLNTTELNSICVKTSVTTSLKFLYTVIYGKKKTDLFRTDITYITKTGINSIIRWITSKYSQRLTIVDHTREKNLLLTPKKRYKILSHLKNVTQLLECKFLGIAYNVGLNFSVQTLTPEFIVPHPVPMRLVISNLITKNENALTAVMNTWLKEVRKNIVPDNVTIMHVHNVHERKKIENANNAKTNLPLKDQTDIFVQENVRSDFITLVNIESLPERFDVFDLSIDKTHEFFANGILVHNCDELAKYRYARKLWDMLQFTMRKGTDPRVMVTTTPRPIPLIVDLTKDKTTKLTRGSTFDNADNLAPRFLAKLKKDYEGTRLGRQELNAEILDDLPGALWVRDKIDETRLEAAPDMVRIVVAIDPSGTRGEEDSGDSIGIVVAGKGVDGRAYILADRTCKLSPDGWGRRAVNAYHEFDADRIVAERNFGGAMVEHVISTIDDNVAYKEVTASRGKVVRAEPVAALYEQGRVTHVGSFPELEDQMCLMAPDGYAGEGSPDRVDALVWAITELMLEDQAQALMFLSKRNRT